LPTCSIRCNGEFVTKQQKTKEFPPEALRELEEAIRGWSKGVPLAELLARVNELVESISPGPGEGSAKVKAHFTERSLRHYQTLGAIDPPAKSGRIGLYRYRHLLQALLVRKLLWQRVPSDRISSLMAGRSNESLIELLVGPSTTVDGALVMGGRDEPERVETWKRVRLAPGVELHLSDSAPMPGAKQLGGILETAERRIREHFR
jgi:DNA-binding transcriptional MerR regulator